VADPRGVKSWPPSTARHRRPAARVRCRRV